MKRCICTIIVVLLMTCYISASPSFNINARVSDGANLLTDQQSDSLRSQIYNVIGRHGFDVVIVTVDSLNGIIPRNFADNYYVYNRFGFGNDYDGVLFLVAMEEREFHTSTNGRGISVLTDARVNEINDRVVSYLSDGDYYRAFSLFISLVDGFLVNPPSDSPVSHPSDSPNLFGRLAGVWIAALIIALIIVFSMKSKLKTARSKPLAHDYVVPGSFRLSYNSDVFVNSHVTKVPRPKDTGSSGGGGSTVHTGSSGRMHGGGGGRF